MGTKEGGFIKVYRSLLQWGWHSDPNTLSVFLHLLLRANYHPSEVEGRIIERGQAVYGLNELAEKCGLSIRQVRTALSHLKSTQELTIEPTHRFSIATIVKYPFYQEIEQRSDTLNDKANDTLPTNNRQADDKLTTTSKKGRKKEDKNVVAALQQTTSSLLQEWNVADSLRDAMEAFAEARRASRHPMTLKALQLAMKQVMELSGGNNHEAVRIIEQSIAAGYRGLFPLKGTDAAQQKKTEVYYADL